MSAKNNNFMTHITGLRGGAILLILIYHISPSLCPNGYYGVDLFLVIAGYLLFLNRIEPRNDFNVVEFSKKKIFRLVPPVLFTISLTLLISIALLPAADMIHAYVDAKRALLLSTNIQINENSNAYFSESVRSFSLMHLWYICVFVQALLFFTCILFIWNKFNFSKKKRIISLSAIGLLSIGIYFVEYKTVTYCWTSIRIWEFVYGGLLTLIPDEQTKRIKDVFYLCALVIFVILSFSPFDFAPKLIPLITILAGIILIGGRHGWISAVLKLCILQKLGKYSFSLYLVHWPIIWIMEYFLSFPLSCSYVLIAFFLTVILAIVMYHTVEKKISMLNLSITAFLAPLLALLIVKTEGFKNFIRAKANNIIDMKMGSICNPPPVSPESDLMKYTDKFVINLWGKQSTNEVLLYQLGETHLPPTFVLLGDSHARHFRIAFNHLGNINHWGGVYFNSYVYPFYGAMHTELGSPDHDNTPEEHDLLINWLQNQKTIKFVVVSQWWATRYHPHRLWGGAFVDKPDVAAARTEQLRQFCIRITEIGKKVIIISDTPSIEEHDPGKFWRRQILYKNTPIPDKHRLECSEQQFIECTKEAFTTFKQLKEEQLCFVLEPHAALFQNGKFSAVDDHLILGDTNHLTTYGAIKAFAPLSVQFKSLLSTHCKNSQ